MGHVIGIDTTYTGNPVSFNAAHGGTMKSISVPFTPIQDLHGYANPWPGGGGKNKYKITLETQTKNGVTATVDADGLIHLSGTATAKTTFLLGSFTFTPDTWYVSMCPPGGSASTYYVYCGWGANEIGNGITRTFSSETTSGFTLTISRGVNVDGLVCKPMICLSSAGTDFAPYSNICPISGLTGLSVYVSPTQDPDDATVYNVDWSTQAGTVYGGALDVVTGVLTVDWAIVDMGTLTWTYRGNGIFTSVGVAGYSKRNSDICYCSAYKGVSAGAFSNLVDKSVQCGNSYHANNAINVKDTAYSDAAIFKTAMSGVQLCYELATPLTYQLTPKQIAALIGQNYIWSSNSETLTAVLTAPATGFAGWLIKCVTNGTPVEIPLKYMRAETYTVTPDQRMEWSAERDVTGVMHRETVQNLPPKIEFNTPLMTNSDINALNSIIKAAFTNYLQRNITIQFYDPERDQYWEWDCYMPDVKYQIRNADIVNSIINYEELRYAFIGY